jgi:hypothetical protein
LSLLGRKLEGEDLRERDPQKVPLPKTDDGRTIASLYSIKKLCVPAMHRAERRRFDIFRSIGDMTWRKAKHSFSWQSVRFKGTM